VGHQPAGTAKWLLGHAAAACVTLILLRESPAILSWLTWHVSPMFGMTGGSFFSVGVTADSIAKTVLSLVLLVASPLVIVGVTAAIVERLRGRIGRVAIAGLTLPAVTSGVAAWLLAPDDVDRVQRGTLAISVAILVALLAFAYWLILVGVLWLTTGGATLALEARRRPTRS
jgi:hypothetical protein